MPNTCPPSLPTPQAPHYRKSGHPPIVVPDQPYHQMSKRPSPEIYQIMGEQQIRAMVDQFYTCLENSPLAPMLAHSKHDNSVNRSTAFFVQTLGGPHDAYSKQYGHPRLRMRHLPFVITEQRRQIWIQCFFHTLDHPQGFTFPPEHLESFKNYLDTFSKWMVNHSSNPTETVDS